MRVRLSLGFARAGGHHTQLARSFGDWTGRRRGLLPSVDPTSGVNPLAESSGRQRTGFTASSGNDLGGRFGNRRRRLGGWDEKGRHRAKPLHSRLGTPLSPDVLLVGGEDHDLRIPFLLALQASGLRIAACGSGDPAPFTRAAIPYWRFEFSRFISPRSDRHAIKQLASVLDTVRPGLVQSFDTKPNLLVPLAARRVPGIPVLRTINGLGWLFSSNAPLALALRPVFSALHRIAARSTAATIFQNDEDRAHFERYRMLGGGPAYLIPGSGVDLAQFDRARTAGPTGAQLRAELGLGDSKLVITVTRLTRQKGIPTLLEAAARVHAARQDVRFVLVGGREAEGPLAVTQAELDAHSPYVLALGKRSDVPALLGMADLFAFPTEYREGIPRALLEAAVAGLPLIATRMPGCTEVVQDGRTGLLVPPRDPAALAASILRLLDDPAAAGAMGSRAATLARQEFGLELTVARFARVYATILEPRPAKSAPAEKEAARWRGVLNPTPHWES